MKRLATCDETNLKIGIPTVLVQQIVRQMLYALDFLHTNCKLVHTDLKLENVIVVAEDVEELVRACSASEYLTGVSPTNATRVVPLKDSSIPSSSAMMTAGGKPSPSDSKNAFGAWERSPSQSPKEITITGSAPLPSPMHAWGRVNVGPEVNSLALIMAQLALERKMAEGGECSEGESSSFSPPIDDDSSSGCCDDHPPSPHSDPQLTPHSHHSDHPELPHRKTWPAPVPSTHSTNSQSAASAIGSGASSLTSVNSSTTLFSMTTSGVSTAPTSMENSLILPASGLVAMSSTTAPKKVLSSASISQQLEESPSSRMMTTPFSFDPDLSEEQDFGPSLLSMSETMKKRLSSQSNLTLKREDLASPSSSSSKEATLTPTSTPTPYSQQAQQHQPPVATASLLTAKKPTNVPVNPSTPTFTLPISRPTSANTVEASPYLSASTSSSPSPSHVSNTRGRHLVDSHPDDPFLKSSPTLPKPPPRIRIKIADMGNATPVAKHFTPDIQTRPYRAPEVILGYKNWDESVDIWSVGCMVFELLTSDLLFFAEEDKKWGKYSRDDDQLAQMMELLGDFPWTRKWGGRYSKDFFNAQGSFGLFFILAPIGPCLIRC